MPADDQSSPDHPPPGSERSIELAPLELIAEQFPEAIAAGGELLIATNWIDTREQDSWPLHHHAEHELLWGVDGTVIADVAGQRFTVPPLRGLWIPRGQPHRVTNVSATRLSCTWFSPAFVPWSGPDVFTLPLSTLLREALGHLRLPSNPIVAGPDRRRRAEMFAFDLLDGELGAAWSPPMPTSPDLRRLAEAMQHNPGGLWDLTGAADYIGISDRSLRRRFLAETGIGFAQWRRSQRIHAAIPMLLSGVTVATVAKRLGYRSASAFTQAYRVETGQAPVAHVRELTRLGVADNRHNVAE